MSPLTSSYQFSTNPSCSLLPCASLMFIGHLFIMLPQGSLGFLIRTSSDWSRGFSSCYHSKMGKHIAKSSSLTVVDRCTCAGGVVPALFSSWLWLLLVFTVVVLAINGAGAVVVLVVFIVKWLLLWCANCNLCKKNRGQFRSD